MIRIAALALALAAAPAAAQPVAFDGAWQENGLLRLRTNDYALQGDRLGVVSNGTVSILYRRFGPGDPRMADRASWDWAVQRSVPATDLTRKGGDDRNLAVYFVFVPEGEAAALEGQPLRRLLNAQSARVLVYVWGGQAAAGSVLPSPYLGDRGRTIVLQPAGTGQAQASVDLSADLQRAFGSRPGVLLGVAVSADADDTDSRVEASVANLRLD